MSTVPKQASPAPGGPPAQKQQSSMMTTIHTFIGVAIMLFGPFLSAPQFSFPESPKLAKLGFEIVNGSATIAISEAGWAAAIIFIGLIYLWIFVDTFWPSLLAVALVALNPSYPLPKVISQYIGNPIIFLIFFLLFFAAALVKSNTIAYIANFFLTNKALQGRPWRLLATLMICTYLCCFITAIPSLFFMWSVIYFILKEIGQKPGDRLATFMIGNTVAAFTLLAATDMVKGPPLFMSVGYNNFITQNPNLGLGSVEVGSWVLMGICFSLFTMAAILFSMRFIFKVNVDPLRNLDTDTLQKEPLPPMNWQQKSILGIFALFALWMVLPSFLPQSIPFVAYVKSKTHIGSMVIFTALVAIRYKGENIVKIPEIAGAVPWNMFFLLASVFYFSTILIDPQTNLPILLETSISNLLTGFNSVSFFIITIVLALVLTNVMNSIVAGNIVAPVIAAVAHNYGFDVMPLVVIFILVLNCAILTPAAGMAGAVLYGNKEWLPGKESVFYAFFLSAILLVGVIVVGIPLSKILF